MSYTAYFQKQLEWSPNKVKRFPKARHQIELQPDWLCQRAPLLFHADSVFAGKMLQMSKMKNWRRKIAWQSRKIWYSQYIIVQLYIKRWFVSFVLVFCLKQNRICVVEIAGWLSCKKDGCYSSRHKNHQNSINLIR